MELYLLSPVCVRSVIYNEQRENFNFLQGYPYKKATVLKEAHKDIPPLYRGNIWAALLEVDGDVDGKYAAVDKETPTHTDRQVIVLYPTAVYGSRSVSFFKFNV